MQPLSSYHFETVTRDTPFFVGVSHEFNQVIAPIYGDQTTALNRIAAAVDRTCEVLINDSTKEMAGILVYKNEPTDEFLEFEAPKALEIKTLFVVNAATQSGRGIGTKLIDRIKEVASAQKFQSIAVTVSDEKTESQEFFTKKSFSKVFVFHDKYKQGINEALFIHKK